jgi:subtilisin family serine protease
VRTRAIAIVLLTALLGVVFAHPMAQGRRPGKMSPGLRARVATGERVPVVIELRAQPDDAPDLPRAHAITRGIARAQDGFLLRTPGYGHIKRLTSLPIVAIEVDERVLADLDADADVISVTLDEPRKPSLMTSVPLIGAPTAWSLGASGAGWSIAVLDTGVAKQHPFLAGKVVSEACYGTNAADAASTSTCPDGVDTTAVGSGLPCPANVYGCNHGTHIAGIAAGHSASLSGVARAASIIAIKVFSSIDDPSFCYPVGPPCAGAFDSDILAGLDRVYALRTQFDIAAVNLSLGGGEYSGSCDADEPAYKTAIDLLRSVDIATVISSGNSGSASTMGAPACISSAVAVGASTKTDLLATFTSRSPLLALLAPGTNIYSSVPGGGYATFSGTSMAAPHVAGAWAVLKSRNPTASVTDVETALTSTGLPIADAANARTWPRLRVGNAVKSVPLAPPVVTSLVESPALPQFANVAITWTARAVGGTGTLQYKFWLYTAATGAWTLLRDYSTTTSVVWTPTVPGTYAVRVWVRRIGSSADFEAERSSGNFSIDSLGTSNFVLNSQKGDYVGGGQHIVRSSAGANMTLQTVEDQGAFVSYFRSDPVSFWYFRFRDPNSQFLTPGAYEGATRWGVPLPGVPSMDVSGDGRGCNVVTGRFVVLDVEVVNDAYTRFAADFEQHCEGFAGILFGSVRFNSVVPPSERPVAIQSFKTGATLPGKAGVPMKWTATAIGGGPPLQYKFLVYSKTTNMTTIVQDGPSNVLVWTPPFGGTYKLQVWVRSTNSQAPYEASAGSAEFSVTPGPVQITAFGANVAFPTPVNTIIMWTAAATGGTGNFEYQYWRYRASTNIWTLVQKYSALSTFTWQPSAGEAGTYAVQVRVRSVGSTAPMQASRSTGNFVITAGP